MRRFVVVVAAGTLALAALSAEAATPSFRYGGAAGEITSTSALLWTRGAQARASARSRVSSAGRRRGRCEIGRDFLPVR